MGCWPFKKPEDGWPYFRFKLWYFCFYFGIGTLTVFCFIYSIYNPDQDAWFGTQGSIEEVPNKEKVGEIKYETITLYYIGVNEDAVLNQGAKETEHVRNKFLAWFWWGWIYNTIFLAVSFVYDFVFANAKLKMAYDIGCCLFVVWYIMGAFWRYFKDSGRAVCGDSGIAVLPPDLELMPKSCDFLRYFIDFYGLYLGAALGWYLLLFSGAAKTPVWDP